MKIKLTTVFLSTILFIGLNFCGYSQSNDEKQSITITTTDEKGKEKTITLDFSDLERSLDKLGEQLEQFGESLEKTGVEVIEVDKTNRETVIEITEEDLEGNELKKTLTGKEAEKYLEKRAQDDESRIVINVDGSLSIDKKGSEKKENFHMEIDFNDFLKDIGIEVDSDDGDEHKQVIIIRKEAEKAK